MICDAHIHFIPKEISKYSSFYKDIWTDKEKLFEYLLINKIDKAVLVYPATDAYLKLSYRKLCEIYNSSLETLMKENSKIIGLGIVDLDNDITSQIKYLKDMGFRGISIPSSQDGKFILDKLFPLFEAVEKYSFIVFVHPQTINPIGFERVKDPLLMPVLEYSFDSSMFMGLLMMEGILERFKINFIFASLGGVMPFLKDRLDRVYLMLRKRQMVKDLGKLPSEILKQIYTDSSGASLENIKLAIKLFGEDRVLLGSDYPVHTGIGEDLGMIDSLGSTIKEKIIFKNFIRLFNKN